MKNLCLLPVVALMLSGCLDKTNDDWKPPEIQMPAPDKDLKLIMEAAYAGGQPGKISVKGIVVKKTAAQTQLDDRITVVQTGGRANKLYSQVQSPVTSENKAILTDTLDLEIFAKLPALKSFINIGCTNLSPDDIKGLREEAAKGLGPSMLSLSASKIFICGAPALGQTFVTLSADQLILRNANLLVTSSTGNLSVSANKIYLEGKNSLRTSGKDTDFEVIQAPPLSLSVGTEIHGEGSLLLQSTGGNCIESEPTK